MPSWVWIVGIALLIGILAAGYRSVQIQHRLHTVQTDFAAAKDEARQANERAADLRKQADNLKSELAAANTQHNEVQTKLDAVTSKLEALNNKLNSAQSEIQEKQSRLDALQSDITGATQASDLAKSEAARANDEMQSRLDEANAVIKRLRSELAEAKTAPSNENPQPAPSESPGAQPPAEVPGPTTVPAPSTNDQ
jgi:chromosome segregation ATPase